MSITKEKKLTLAEHLTSLDLQLERNEIQWLSSKVAQAWRERYPEPLKKVYRANDRNKQVAVGYGYDDRVIDIIDKFIQL